MITFRVHYELDGSNKSDLIDAKSSEHAANAIRNKYPGAIVHKVKVDRSGN